MDTHIITPGPYRATKLWNEVTRLFRSGMPIRKHRQSLRVHSACFKSAAAVDWLHQMLRNNSNFGPDVTRQQTVQLLKKFLKNHVIEDVKGRWGSEDLEENGSLYRFPSTSPLKPIPTPTPKQTSTPGSGLKRTLSLRDKEGLFRFRSTKKLSKETQENEDPALQVKAEKDNGPMEDQQRHKRELTHEDEQEIWKEIALTHLQKILGIASLDEVLDQQHVNPQNIIHNLTKVNKHGVVTLDDKTDDLPHWVLSAMKSLANWPKYDCGQPSYPGFERDVFKTVSDYFYSLAQPLLTFQLYELFINVLVLCGYVVAPPRPQQVKRRTAYPPYLPPPTKMAFRSTECLLLSLIRRGSCDEAESPMREVFGPAAGAQLRSLQGVTGRRRASACDAGASAGPFGGSHASLTQSHSSLCSARLRPRSCSMENVLDDDAPIYQKLFLSNECLSGSAAVGGDDPLHAKNSESNPVQRDAPEPIASTAAPDARQARAEPEVRKRLSLGPLPGLASRRRSRLARPFSTGSCLDIVLESREETSRETAGRSRAASCLNISTPARGTRSTSTASARPPSPAGEPCPSSSTSEVDPSASRPPGSSTSSSSSLWSLNCRATANYVPIIARRCHSSLDLSGLSRAPQPTAENSLLQSHCERVAIQALQLCTLLLPPASRRKLQLLMRMMSRISQNVDMPRLHHAIGTRTLMVHTFSGCVLGSAEECDLDELLATRLVSFLMDHQHTILSVPEYLLSAVTDHVQYLRSTQLAPSSQGGPGVDVASAPMLLHAFCRQISSVEFEEQRVAASQRAMEELLEILLTDRSISDKDRRKRLKQFRKQYPDIYSRRVPASDREDNKPKIKPQLLNIRKTKAFSIRH